MNQKYIYVDGKKVYVTDKVYRAYKKEKNHADYLDRMQMKNKVFGFGDYNLSVEDIPDDNVDIENIIKTKMLIEDLYRAIDTLSDEEKYIVNSLFFEERTIRDVAKLKNVSSKKIFNLKHKILEKLKELLK